MKIANSVYNNNINNNNYNINTNNNIIIFTATTVIIINIIILTYLSNESEVFTGKPLTQAIPNRVYVLFII